MKILKNEIALKKILFTTLIVLLSIPMLQHVTKLIDETPLKGSFSLQENPEITASNWFNGTFQEDKGKFINHHFGFRNVFVRLYNQTEFSLYNEVNANSVILGKENYLYEENYIKAYTGANYVGADTIARKVEKLAEIEKVLTKKGIELIILLAPGKGSFYPEFIPDRYHQKQKSTTNYQIYSQELAKTNLNFLDFHSWFLSMKKTSRYPLFPKTGIHWSRYGEILAADSILKYIGAFNTNESPVRLNIDEIELSKTMRDTDDDIEQGMNLLFNISDLEMGYPKYKLENIDTLNNATVLTVADSYYWGMFNLGLSRDAFNNGEFWYYNQQIYPDSYEKSVTVQDINFKEKIEENDVVLIICTDANLYKFGFGFIDRLYDEYCLSNDQE